MATRARVRWYGSAGVLVVAGIVVIAASGSVLAEAVSISLVSLGLIVMISLMFFEVGLSEDRERARETERRRREEDTPAAP
ncbi:MAG: hypothetical protein QOE27_186, partial [Solirubrobacteraceae bacterium]|nr:hypothetical protein [Solirubrobacteraceae bacterium]